jgi:hypothetical protein
VPITGIVLAERVGFRHWHVGTVGQRLDHAIFAVDLVRRGQQLARRLLAQHVHALAAVRQMERRIALATFELKNAQGRAESVDVRRHVLGEARFVET